VLFLNF